MKNNTSLLSFSTIASCAALAGLGSIVSAEPLRQATTASPTTPQASPAGTDKSKAFIDALGIPQKDYVISRWPVTFVGGGSPGFLKSDGTVFSTSNSAGRNNSLDGLCASLNQLFADVHVSHQGDVLTLVGPRDRVVQVKMIIAKWIDVPLPLVRLNVMTFQCTALDKDQTNLADAVQLAADGIAITKAFVLAYTSDLQKFVTSYKGTSENDKFLCWPITKTDQDRVETLFRKMHLIGTERLLGRHEDLDSGRTHIKPLIDDLAFYALSNRSLFTVEGSKSQFQSWMNSQGASVRLLKSVADRLSFQKDQLESMRSKGDVSASAKLDVVVKLQKLCESLQASAFPAFPGFNLLLTSGDSVAERKTLLDFITETERPHPGESNDELKKSLEDLFKESLKGKDKVGLNKLRDLITKSPPTPVGGMEICWIDQQIKADDDENASRECERKVIQDLSNSRSKKLNELGSKKQQIDEVTVEISRIDALIGVQSKAKPRDSEKLAKLTEHKFASVRKLVPLERDAAKLAETIKELESEIAAKQAKIDGPSKPTPERLSNQADAIHQKVVDLLTESIHSGKDVPALKLLVDIETAHELTIREAIKALKEKQSRDTATTKLEIEMLEERLGKSVADKEWLTDRSVDPEYLTVLSSSVDTMIRNASETIARDVNAAAISPLLRWIENNNRGKKDGLVLMGNVSIAVTSEQSAATGGSISHLVPFTAQQSLSSSDVSKLLAGGKSSLIPDSLFSAAGAVDLLTALAAFRPDPAVYTSIAPGQDVAVRPTVLPGSDSARLQINYRVTQSVQDRDTTKPRKDVLSTVDSHSVSTDVAVNGFDIFELSTLSSQVTVVGDPRWSIPGLEGLPIIGNVFVGPRSPMTSAGKSLVIVFSTIIPRSLDITRRYAASSDSGK